MDRIPVAQASNGQPFVDPNARIEGETMDVNKPVSNLEATLWTTQTVTSTDISILVSTSVTISTSVVVSTSYVSTIEISQFSGTQNATPQTTSPSDESSIPVPDNNNTTLPSPFSPFATGLGVSCTSEFTQATDIPSSTNLLLPGNNGNSTFGVAPSTAANIPTSAQQLGTGLPVTSMVSAHTNDALPRLMGGMVAGIFLLAGLLSGGLFIFRRRQQRVSEQEEAANAQRQQQPLMTVPIVPYSSAYGSDLQH